MYEYTYSYNIHKRIDTITEFGFIDSFSFINSVSIYDYNQNNSLNSISEYYYIYPDSLILYGVIDYIYDDNQDLISVVKFYLNEWDELTYFVKYEYEYGNTNHVCDRNVNGYKEEFYPNPADEFLEIDFSLEMPNYTQLKIVNTLGQVYYDREFLPGQMPGKINTKNFPSGSYYLILRSGCRVETKPVMVLH